ncbi:MAG: tetratricopeptide repeat protein, partial [Holophagae bacterium]
KIIHLYRENPLKHTLSHITVADLVKRTNSWEVYKDKDKAAPVEVDLKSFAATLSYIQEFERRTHCFALQFDDVLHLSFEKLTADIPATLVEVQEFLRVAPRTDIIEPTKKLTSNDLSVAIANYDTFSVFAYNLITLGGMRDSGYYPYLDHKDEVIERLMELHPDRAQLRLEAGWLALQNGDRQVATQRLAEAREMEPDSPELADLEEALGTT